jgi:diguanylate cyclase (GGDEF)-like protein
MVERQLVQDKFGEGARLFSFIRSLQRLNTELFLSDLFKSIVSVAVEYLAAHRGVLVLSNDQGEDLRVVAEGRNDTVPAISLIDCPLHSDRGNMLVPVSMIDTVVRTLQPLLMEDLSELPFFSHEPSPAARPLRAAAFPLLYQHVPIGVLYTECAGKDVSSPADCFEIGSLLAQHAAITVVQTRLYQQVRRLVDKREGELLQMTYAFREEVARRRRTEDRVRELETQLSLNHYDLPPPSPNQHYPGTVATGYWSDYESQMDLLSWVAEMEQYNRDITLLNGMSEVVHSCVSSEEVYDVVSRYAAWLFPEQFGALYINSPGEGVYIVSKWGNTDIEMPHTITVGECWALRRGRPYVVRGNETGRACCQVNTDTRVQFSVCAPLVSQREMLGIFTVYSETLLSQQEADRYERLVTMVADNLSMTISNIRLRESLHQQALHDPLTNLFNRRYLEDALRREEQRARRRGSVVGIIMLDVDHFKHFNDTYGHDGGDALLRVLGQFLRTRMREEHTVCRYGGEEFAIVLPDTTQEHALKWAEAVRTGVESLEVEHYGQPLSNVTTSIGVAVFPTHGDSLGAVLVAADKALYRAKQEGRNRVCSAERGGD